MANLSRGSLFLQTPVESPILDPKSIYNTHTDPISHEDELFHIYMGLKEVQ